MYKATIQITLRPSILDPQGKATHHALENLGHKQVREVRIGKRIDLVVDTENEKEAHAIVTDACDKLLANPVMEDYEIRLERIGKESAV